MITKTIAILLIFSNSIVSYSQSIISNNKINGLFTIECKVNGLKLEFIFDTGASDVTISLTEAMFMIKNGYLNKEDIGETIYYKIANGNVEKGTKINIREIEINGIKLYNIQATIIHESSAPLLLGMSAINKLGKIEISGNSLYIYNKTKKSTNPTTKINLETTRIYTITNVFEKINDTLVYSANFGHIMIFNRWGNTIFNSSIHDNNKIYLKNNDVYYYILYSIDSIVLKQGFLVMQ